MELGDALAWLDAHQNLERMLADRPAPAPDLDRMRALVGALGDPQQAQPALHVTGTNGKTSTARALTQLLMAKGLSVGTYTSPHLEQINERISANGEPISDEDLAEALTGVAAVEPLVPTHRAGPESGNRSGLSWFELITAAGLRWFADRPVDVAVVEVGLGGRWDATNVVDGSVAVVTNVELDHVEFLGSTRGAVASEKAGIIKPGSALVLGEEDPQLYEVFAAEHPDPLWWKGRDWAVEANRMAVGGRILDIHTPGAHYESVFLDLHGAHQGSNFAAALVAAEAFFGRPLEAEIVAEAAASVSSPGRMEVVGRRPLLVLDGAKNTEGARAAAAALAEEFAETRSTILVVGMLRGKDAAEMLEALGGARARLVVACPPPSPRAQSPGTIVAAAAGLGVPGMEADSVPAALEVALAAADPDDLVVVSGSLYVVGAARAHLHGRVG